MGDYQSDLDASRPYSVSEITGAIKSLLERGFPRVAIEGEISNAKYASSGHCYFTLKDDAANISAVMFRGRLDRSSVRPTDGEQVTVHGAIGVYARRGSYQIIVDSISRTGIGRILQIIEERKQRLAAEGLFSADRKRPLPLFPRRVAIVTSPTGAAIRDILNVTGRRNAGIHLIILPCAVQGDEAPDQISAQIQRADRLHLADVIIVGRGGGSIEDLLAFSDESVVRAIAASETPVISAVGHETDTTLSDLAADYRAPTPSAAAEIVSASRDELLARVLNTGRSLVRAFLERRERARLTISRFSTSDLERSIRYALQPRFQELDDVRAALHEGMDKRLVELRHRLALAKGGVEASSPYTILERGYALVRGGGQVVTSAGAARKCRDLDLQFHDGTIAARTNVENDDERGASDEQ